tara:strand:- start:25 stop:237 length:213 start_codon:yes stop_codon:yes gene_type:complete
MIKYFIIIFFVNTLNACAVCYGAPDDPITIGLNKAIVFLLGIVAFVLSCIIYGIYSLIKRSKNIKTEGVI